MTRKRILKETELTALAKELRAKAGRTSAEAARDLGVTRGTIHQAENMPAISLTKLRCRMIERYSKCQVEGPVFLLKCSVPSLAGSSSLDATSREGVDGTQPPHEPGSAVSGSSPV